MRTLLRSLWIWSAICTLIVLWYPFLLAISLVDRDPIRYRTGRWFRRLGVAMTKVNPTWHLDIGGYTVDNPRNPYVVVSNHLSIADIPLISHLPWEMKWVGKEELFRLPFAGWMMRLARDLPLDRGDARSGARMILRALKVLEQKCSVMIFPEGTRSPDGRLGRFSEGAFLLAIRARVPVLPVAIEGSHDCIPKRSWVFGEVSRIRLEVLAPVPTEGLTSQDALQLSQSVRAQIASKLAHWRGLPIAEVDATLGDDKERVRRQAGVEPAG